MARQTSYQGPLQPGVTQKQEEEFRRTGKITPVYSGPVPEGADERTFRRTGTTIDRQARDREKLRIRQEAEKQKAIEEAARKAAELERQAQEAKRASEQRRLQMLASRERTKELSVREGVSQEVAATRLRSQAAGNIREEARERKVDISTRARERGFLSQLRKEEDRNVKILEKKQKDSDEVIIVSDETTPVTSKKTFSLTQGYIDLVGKIYGEKGLLPVKEIEFDVFGKDYKVRELPPSSARYLDVFLKSALFSPAFATGTESLGTAIETKQITPVSETEFKSFIKKKGSNIDEIFTISKTKTGGAKTIGISKQIVKDVGDDASVGIGRAFDIRKIKGGEEISKVDFAGKSVRLGESKAIKKGKISVEADMGEGVYSRIISKEMGRVSRKAGKTKTLQPDLSFEGTEVTGVIREAKPNIYSFVGETGKPLRVSRITDEGIKKTLRITEPNIKGIIQIRSPTTKTFDVSGSQGLSSPVEKTILKQVGSLVKTSQKAVVRDIPKTSFSKIPSHVLRTEPIKIKTSQIQKTKTRTQSPIQMEKQMQKDAQISTTKLGVSQFSTPSERTSERTKSRLSSVLKEEQKLRQLLGQGVRQKEGQKQKQKQALKLKQLQRQILEPRGKYVRVFIPRTPRSKPKPFPEFPPFLFGFKVQKKGRERLPFGFGKEDIGISEGFTAKVLGLKPVKVSRRKLAMGEFPQDVFGLRRKPILID